MPAVLSGAGPAVLALTTDSALPAEALEFGAAHGFAVDEMAVGRPVEWGPGDGRDASGGAGESSCLRQGRGLLSMASRNRGAYAGRRTFTLRVISAGKLRVDSSYPRQKSLLAQMAVRLCVQFIG